MKSFFKKLSLVLAAAMVITMLPAQIAKAAPTPLKIRKDSQAKAEATVAPTYNLMVGDQIDITFDGATGYDAAAKLTKKWDSKDKTVATVDGNGLIKALKPGTTVIKITCTAKGVDYEGTATVNVTDSKLEVRQTAQDTITAFFANEAEATAAQKNAKIYLVQRAQKTTRLRDARVTPKAVEDTVVFEGLADGLEYQVNIAGTTVNITMSVGDPDTIVLEYPVVKVGKGVDLANNSITQATAAPTIKVYDIDKKLITYDKNKISFKQLEKKGNANLATSGTTKGTVTFTNGNTESEVKVQVTYKFTDSAKKEQSITATAFAQVDAYSIPTLGGWAESIVAVKPGTENKKITYPTTDDFSVELNVGEKVELAYYFLGSDGVQYTGANVKSTAAYVDGNKKIVAILNPDYKFYFEKDDTTKINVSLPSADAQLSTQANPGRVTVTAWKEGTEVISLYRAKDKNKADSTKDMYLGSITVKVNAERVIDRIVVDENSVTGFKDAATNYVELPFKVIDQYQDAIGTAIKIVQPASANGGVTVSSWDASKGTGKVKFDFSLINKTSADSPITVKLTADYSDVVTEVTVYSYLLSDNTEATPEYVLEVDSKKAAAKNVDFKDATNVNALGITIKVAESILGVKKGNISFRLVNNNFEEDAACTGDNNSIYVVVYDADGKPVNADVSKSIVARTATTVASATSFGAATAASFFFDLYKDATNVSDGLFAAGSYRIVAYQVVDNFAQQLGDPVIVEVGNKMELIQSVDSTYKLKADSDKVVREKDGSNKDVAVTTAKGAYSDALVATIVGQLYGWYDANSDGKATTDEVKSIALLAPGFTVNTALSKYYQGATGELYINYVTIEYSTPVGAKVQQRIPVDRKFQIQ